MGELDTLVQASLGRLAVLRGVISEPARERLARDLLECARAGKPRSLARLLLQGGFTAQAVQELLQQGARLEAVACDACGEAHPQQALNKREEVPCRRCGSLVLGFAAYSRDAARPSPDEGVGIGDDTRRMGPDDPTDKWKGVLPTPEQRESAGTERWRSVLPLPLPDKVSRGGTPPAGVPRGTPSGGVPGGGRAPRNVTPEDDPAGRTLMFEHVLPKPSEGTIKLFPGEAAEAMTPGAPKGSPFEDSGPVARDLGLGPTETDRTMTFADVFLLPGRSAPRSDAEVTDEMNTLLGVTPLALPPRTMTRPPPTPPAGVPRKGPPPRAPISVSDAIPENVAPADFDPGGVTAPMSKLEIQAALAQGPPARPAAPAGGFPSSSEDVQLTVPPTYSPGALPAPAPAEQADKKRSTKGRRRPPPAAKRSKLPLLLLALVVVLGGLAAALAYWARSTGRL